MGKTGAIEDILTVAVNAPSGDNSQPWRFFCTEDTISLYNIPARDETPYNFRERGSYLSHGALIENICVVAGHRGFSTSVSYFPGEKNCTARISLTVTPPHVDPLFDAVLRRTTNRKPYTREPVDTIITEILRESIRQFPDVSLSVIEDPRAIKRLAGVLSSNERIVMENRKLHGVLFGMIRWSKKEEQQKPGLYIKTMEFPPPVRVLLKHVIRHWTAVQLLNRFGFSQLVSRQSAALYASSPAICALVISGENDISFVEAGRALERVWLTATLHNLAIQPVTALPYLGQRLEAGVAEMFSHEHQRMIRDANTLINDVFLVPAGKRIAMVFRIGRAPLPSARSYKAAPIIQFS